MTKFRIKDSQLCWVTWTYHVEAETEADAWDAHSNGDCEAVGPPSIGDASGLFDAQIEVDELKEGDA